MGWELDLPLMWVREKRISEWYIKVELGFFVLFLDQSTKKRNKESR